MIKAQPDMAKLERSLKRAAKGFGESTAQAVTRWGVQTCRELAVQTQVHGIGGARKKQVEAIYAGMLAVVQPVSGRTFTALQRGKLGVLRIGGQSVKVERDQILDSPEAIIEFIDANRGAKGHTKKLPPDRRGVARESDFRKAFRIRSMRAGMAKGPWIGAGHDLARAQRGTQRVTIGKNFLSYAQKHARLGSARRPRVGFRAIASVNNRAKHTSSSYVLKRGAIRTALAWGARKTATWYRRAAKAKLDKA